jgi:Flp pilus assembly protein TadG
MQPHEYSMNSTTAQGAQMRLRQMRCVRRGATMVEMALICGVFLMLLLGMVEIARAMWAREVITSAAREGARYAIVHGANSANPSGPGQNDPAVEARVRRHCYGLEPGRITVTSSWPLGRNDNSSTVKVQVRYAYTSAAGALIGRRNMELSAASEMLIAR